MKTLFIVIILLHGLIHLMGFVKAFEPANISELTLPISRGWGLLWLTAALILILSGLLWLLNVSFWWIPAITVVILSRILVFMFWQDAHFGSIPNVLILIIIVTGFLRHTPPVSMMTEEIPTAPYEERYGAAASGDYMRIINPFEMNIIPMERLVLINIPYRCHFLPLSQISKRSKVKRQKDNLRFREVQAPDISVVSTGWYVPVTF